MLICSEKLPECKNYIDIFEEISNLFTSNDKKILGIGMYNPLKNELMTANNPEIYTIYLY